MEPHQRVDPESDSHDGTPNRQRERTEAAPHDDAAKDEARLVHWLHFLHDPMMAGSSTLSYWFWCLVAKVIGERAVWIIAATLATAVIIAAVGLLTTILVGYWR
jgi:hypothetical protein